MSCIAQRAGKTSHFRRVAAYELRSAQSPTACLERKSNMISGLFNSTSVPLLEQVVNFSQARHNVLAGNIANIDTPGYKTRDLSPELFQERLKDALQERNDMQRSQGLRGASQHGYDPLDGVGRNMDSILRHDGVNVSIEGQVTEISKNQVQHNMALAIMNSQFRLLNTAISERV
jgi:flagellar basal-body rod protein FlgB